jgi:triosephosphate isomerase
MRKKIIAGNWKMNKTVQEAFMLVQELKPLLADHSGADIVVCPPFTALHAVRQAIDGSGIRLGAQGVFWKRSGAYTSSISPAMLVDVGVQYVIIGHSETRGRFGVAEEGFTDEILAYFGESNTTVNWKTVAALGSGLKPIVCVGETLAERKLGHTDAIVTQHVTLALDGIAAGDVANNLIFAYEPVWAIGTGEVCAADEADRICGLVRSTVADLYDAPTANAVRVQYGGSMKPDNAVELLAKPNIDGGLIGGASLKAPDFAAIVNACG